MSERAVQVAPTGLHVGPASVPASGAAHRLTFSPKAAAVRGLRAGLAPSPARAGGAAAQVGACVRVIVQAHLRAARGRGARLGAALTRHVAGRHRRLHALAIGAQAGAAGARVVRVTGLARLEAEPFAGARVVHAVERAAVPRHRTAPARGGAGLSSRAAETRPRSPARRGPCSTPRPWRTSRSPACKRHRRRLRPHRIPPGRRCPSEGDVPCSFLERRSDAGGRASELTPRRQHGHSGPRIEHELPGARVPQERVAVRPLSPVRSHGCSINEEFP